jgi:hypothetical protein
VWWCIAVIPALKRLWQGSHDFGASLDAFFETLSQKQKRKKEKEKQRPYQPTCLA